MLFYSGLHWIDAYLAGKNFHPANHEYRDDEIENNGSLSDIYKPNCRLKDLSRAARYEIPDFAVGSLTIAQQKLANIKNHIRPLL